MKRIAGFLFVATLLMAGAASAQPDEFSGNVGIFYNSLSSYGEWVNADIGYAWRPLRISHHWRPYLYGRWIWTDYGWYWVSDEPFGWATFHYGRWIYDDYYGWIWMPDRVWGPAWVEWRYDNDYVGWAPLPPYAEFGFDIGIRWTTRWAAPVHYWNFLSCSRFTTARVADYVEPVERARRIFGNTRSGVVIRGDRDRVINGGVEPRFIERRGDVRVPRAEVVDRNAPSVDRFSRADGRERIEAYRPRIDERVRMEGAPPDRRPRSDRSDDRTGRAPAWRGDQPAREQQRQIEERRGSGEQQRRIEERRGNGEQQQRIEERRGNGEQQGRIEERRGAGEQQRQIEQRRAERQREENAQREERQAWQQQRRAQDVQSAPRVERDRERPSVGRAPRQESGRGRDQGRPSGNEREQRPRGRRPG